MQPTLRLTALFAIAVANGALAMPPYLELIPLTGTSACTVHGMSADGTVIVGSVTGVTPQGEETTRPYVWRRGAALRTIPLPPGFAAGAAMAVSFDGSTIVGFARFGANLEHQNAWIWSGLGNVTPLGDLEGGVEVSDAVDVSDDGTIVLGTVRANSRSYAALWRASEGWSVLEPLPIQYPSSAGGGISGDGSVVALSCFDSLSNSLEAYRWTPQGQLDSLGDFAGSPHMSAAAAISRDGSTIIGSVRRNADTLAFAWRADEGELEDLGHFSEFPATAGALGVNADGSIIVGRASTGGPTFGAFIWDRSNGLRSLASVLQSLDIDLGFTALWQANCVSDDGRTVAGIAFIGGTDLRRPFVAYLGSACPADFDDGYRRGAPDGAVTIDDLVYYLTLFANGNVRADIDDGSTSGARDAAVTIADLIYFLTSFENGC